MKQIRKRLTYANVMSSIAVFLVLGGATALAAGQLGKNTVGSKQLKKNAVTAAKIKNNAVTAAKIKNGTISGSKINLGSLGTVPSATNATNAANALNATNALNAANSAKVNGQTVTKIFAKLAKGTTTTLGTFGPFKVVGICTAGGTPEIEVDPQTSDTDYSASGNGATAPFFIREQGVEPNSKIITEGNVRGDLLFVGAQSGGAVVSGILGWDDASSFNNEPVCAIYGHLTS